MPDGLRMADAKDTPGVQRALLFGEEQGTSGPTLFRAADDTETESEDSGGSADDLAAAILLAAAALAAAVVTTVVIVKHGPRVVAWWKQKAFPALSGRVMKVLRIEPKQLIDAESETAMIGPVPTAEFAREVAVVVGDAREEMSTDEAKRRLLLVMMAASIISEQMRKLSAARIEGDDLNALQAAMSKLTTGEVVDDLNRVLASERAIIDDQTQALFVEVFGGGRVVDGRYEPLTLDGVKKALRLPDDDPDAAPARRS